MVQRLSGRMRGCQSIEEKGWIMGLYTNQMLFEFAGRMAKKMKEKQEAKRAASSGSSGENGNIEETAGNNKSGKTGSHA